MGCPYGHPDPLEEPSIMEISRRQDRRSRQTNHPLTILSVISSASFQSNHYLHCHYHCHHSTPPYHNLYGPFGCARKETFPSPRSVPNYGMPFPCIPSYRPWARLIAKCCDDSAKIVGVDEEVSIWSTWAAGLWMTEGDRLIRCQLRLRLLPWSKNGLNSHPSGGPVHSYPSGYDNLATKQPTMVITLKPASATCGITQCE